MVRRGKAEVDRLTEEFFAQARQHFLAGKSLEECGKALHPKLSVNAFRERINEAFQKGYLVLKGKLAEEKLAVNMQSQWLTVHGQNVQVRVADGSPDNAMFALVAAEILLCLLRDLLQDGRRTEVNIGIVSGSSTGETVKQLVESRLWDELIGNADNISKTVNIAALNVTPVDGWELEGNANIAVLRMAEMLRDRLPKSRVTPYGLSSTLVVSEAELGREDTSQSNKKVLELADPDRLQTGAKSRLDLVITGVGTPENSVFKRVLDAERIKSPKEMVGDVAFWPVDSEGNPLTLTRKAAGGGEETCLIYSAIRLRTLQELVKSGARVVLIARNKRRGDPVDKTEAILAAVSGGYIDHFVTDMETAGKL